MRASEQSPKPPAIGRSPAISPRSVYRPTSRSAGPGIDVRGLTSLVETLDGIPEDDDLNFTMLALAMVERHGDKLATADVAQAWLDNLPAGRVFTAERAVYRNLLLGIEPERAAVVRNPFREWIGALIRADLYGWAHPGDPSAAARLADADASLSHRGDGVYGARWVAGMARGRARREPTCRAS